MDGPKLKQLSLKVISGGQTGADRAGIEAAFDLGLRTGGWAPPNFLTSKGKDPLLGSKFRLAELPCAILFQPVQSNPVGPPKASVAQMYVRRSQRNVEDSDGTLAFRLQPGNGTDKTIGYCKNRKWAFLSQEGLQQEVRPYKPCLVISDLSLDKRENQISSIVSFIQTNNIRVLNIAGHREEVVPNFSQLVKELVYQALLRLANESSK